MNKLLIFLDEVYYKKDSTYVSNYAAGSFFDEIDLCSKSFLVPVSKNEQLIPTMPSSMINTKENNILELPEWNSTIEYLVKMLKSSKLRKKVNRQIDAAVDSNDIFWVRFPSLVGLKLIKKALKEQKKVMIHHAGDIGEAWNTDKYKGHKKIFAFILSKYMHHSMQKLARNKLCSHFCTGSKVYSDIKKQNSNTQFFIDSKVRKRDLKSQPLSSDIKRFIFIGKLIEGKGILDLINIFNVIAAEHKNIELTIIGFGELEEEVKRMISKSPYPSIFKYVGSVANSEIRKHLNTSDYLIFPSKIKTEGFPRVIIEAWSQSLIVLSNNVGGIEGLAINNKNVLFSQLGNLDELKENLELIIKNKVDVSAMQEFIIESRDNITYEYYKKQVEEVIDGL